MLNVNAKFSYLTPLKSLTRMSIVKFLLVVNTFLVLFLFTNTQILNKPVMQASVQKGGVDFDRRAQDPALSSPKMFSENRTGDQKDLAIHLRMKVYALSGYSCVFQTAPQNQGIRLEMAKPAMLALFRGSGDTAANTPGFVIDNALVLNRWYDLTLDIDKDDHIRVLWNGDQVLNAASASKRSPYKISEVWIGSGFNHTRLMDGAISDFNMQYRLYADSGTPQSIWFFRFFFLITWIVGVIVLGRHQGAAWFSRHWQSNVFNPRLQLAILIMLLGLAVAVFFHGLEFRLWYPGAYLPHGTFLCYKNDLFNDFFNAANIPRFPILACWGLPPLNLLFWYFWKGMRWLFSDAAAYSMYTLLWIWLLAVGLKRLLNQSQGTFLGVLLVLLLSYPFIFTVNRGNPAGWVAAFYVLGLGFFRKRQFGTAALWFSLAAGFKITPLLFGLFFIGAREWRYFRLFCFLCLLNFLLPYFILTKFILPEYSLSLFSQAVQSYVYHYAVEDSGLAWGSSLWGAIKYIYYSFGGFTSPALAQWLSIYQMATFLLFIPVAYAGIKKNVSLLDRAVLVTCWLLLAPPIMADYYLTFLYVPLALVCTEEAHRYSFAYLILICLAMIPKAYGWLGQSAVSIGVLLNPIILLCLFTLCTLHICFDNSLRDWRHIRMRP